jgi:autotransporter strand-loop-strand O-heptosyltransferase
MQKMRRAYVLYGTEAYLPTLEQCALSITAVSDVPVLIYLMGSGAFSTSNNIYNEKCYIIPWDIDLTDNNLYDKDLQGNFYIKRGKKDIYRILTERIAVIEDALLNHADTVVYVDSDSVATEYLDRIFHMYHGEPYVLATEGIYDWMFYDGRGACETRDDMTGTTEYHACQLFGVDQSVRKNYRTTNLFIAGQPSLPFIAEWKQMSKHPEILKNRELYAPYHEETLLNVLLWKYNYVDGLPYLYMNGSVEELNGYYNDEYKFLGWTYHLKEWHKIAECKENVLVMHGEKRVDKMKEMREIVNQHNNLKILFLAPHLSTGGMPSVLLKRIQALEGFDAEIIVVEYSNHSDEYVVQKNEIKKLVHKIYTLVDNKMELIDIIKRHNIHLVHVEEMVEDSVNNFPIELVNELYDNDRTWKIVETCHNVYFKPDIEKKYHPDAYVFCTKYHLDTFKNMPSQKFVLEYPIENKIPSKAEKLYEKVALGMDPQKKHVLNVGLWTPGKNQGEGVEIARQLPDIEFHFVGNQAINFKHYWEPLMVDLPANVHVWGERSDVDKFMTACDIFMFNSTWECNPLVVRQAASHGLPILARNLPQYCGMFDDWITPLKEDDVLNQLLSITAPTKKPISEAMFNFKVAQMYIYNTVLSNDIMLQKINIDVNFVGQPFFEITGRSNKDYLVKFYDENDICVYENTIRSNNWIKLARRWFTNWTIKVWENNYPIYHFELNYTNQRVYISFESSSLGDTIAWMPYALEFKKKHNCHVIVSTFKNFLFEDVYPELEFVEPGTVVNNIRGMYSIGWFYDSTKEPILPNTIPLQKAATNILGLDYVEIRPRIAYTPRDVFDGKIVTIATNSTAGCKFWTREAWQEVIHHLHSKNYRVINVSLEDNPFENCEPLEDKSLQSAMDAISYSEFFIGLSSGLSWLAWAMNKPVVMIANFTEEGHEFSCIRPVKKNVCNGCWNSPKYKFDKSWDWCPVHAGTDRQYECQSSITSGDVIALIESKQHENWIG